MLSTYEITAPAKINLYLRIEDILPNGYHSLNSLLLETDLVDDVVINIDDERDYDVIVTCHNGPQIPNNNNLCYKAATRYLAALKKKTEVVFPYIEIDINKRIPSEAGLGGGSSDAATVLLALDEFFGNPFTYEELNVIAQNVGADTPFFLVGGIAICEGFGEKVTPLELSANLPIILIKPTQGVSTPSCFAEYDDYVRETGYSFESIKYAGLKSELIGATELKDILIPNKELLINDLQKPAENIVSDIGLACELLESNGSFFSAMTGSGSCVFGLFDNEKCRDEAYNLLVNDSNVTKAGMRLFKCMTR